MLDVTREEVEELVADALDALPEAVGRMVDNVVVVVEEESPADGPELLGLYEGIPLTERGGWYAGALPDRVTLFRGPLLRRCADREDLVEQVRVTVVHELAHHLGIDDDELHELGWG